MSTRPERPWRARTMVETLREAAASAPDAPRPDATAPGEDEMERKRIPCPRCGHLRPAFELVDVRRVHEVAGEHVCGGCLGDHLRAGTITRSGLARRLGAPATLITALERAERRERGRAS